MSITAPQDRKIYTGRNAYVSFEDEQIYLPEGASIGRIRDGGQQSFYVEYNGERRSVSQENVNALTGTTPPTEGQLDYIRKSQILRDEANARSIKPVIKETPQIFQPSEDVRLASIRGATRPQKGIDPTNSEQFATSIFKKQGQEVKVTIAQNGAFAVTPQSAQVNRAELLTTEAYRKRTLNKPQPSILDVQTEEATQKKGFFEDEKNYFKNIGASYSTENLLDNVFNPKPSTKEEEKGFFQVRAEKIKESQKQQGLSKSQKAQLEVSKDASIFLGDIGGIIRHPIKAAEGFGKFLATPFRLLTPQGRYDVTKESQQMFTDILAEPGEAIAGFGAQAVVFGAVGEGVKSLKGSKVKTTGQTSGAVLEQTEATATTGKQSNIYKGEVGAQVEFISPGRVSPKTKAQINVANKKLASFKYSSELEKGTGGQYNFLENTIKVKPGLNKLMEKEIIAHELVHSGQSKTLFKIEDKLNIPYKLQPSEIQAYPLGRKLAQKGFKTSAEEVNLFYESTKQNIQVRPSEGPITTEYARTLIKAGSKNVDAPQVSVFTQVKDGAIIRGVSVGGRTSAMVQKGGKTFSVIEQGGKTSITRIKEGISGLKAGRTKVRKTPENKNPLSPEDVTRSISNNKGFVDVVTKEGGAEALNPRVALNTKRIDFKLKADKFSGARDIKAEGLATRKQSTKLTASASPQLTTIVKGGEVITQTKPTTIEFSQNPIQEPNIRKLFEPESGANGVTKFETFEKAPNLLLQQESTTGTKFEFTLSKSRVKPVKATREALARAAQNTIESGVIFAELIPGTSIFSVKAPAQISIPESAFKLPGLSLDSLNLIPEPKLILAYPQSKKKEIQERKSAPVTFTENIITLKQEPAQTSRSILNLRTEAVAIAETKTKAKSRSRSIVESIVESRAVTESVLESKAVVESVLRTEAKAVTRAKTKGATLNPLQLQPPKTTNAIISLLPEKKGGGFFSTQVKKKGKFEVIGTFGTAEAAVNFGKQFIDTTPSASFKVEGNQADVFGAAQKLLPKKFFTESKKDKNIFVERSLGRINTPGERAGITFKGLQALKWGSKKGAFGGRL